MNWSQQYEGMLPKKEIPGHQGYYPACSQEEWDALPALYKAMDWRAIPDPYDKNKKLRAVKAVIFDVVYMEPYSVSAKVSVHPEHVHEILFCSHKRPQCQLYSVCGVELEGGRQLGASWRQDTATGAFGIYSGGELVARQGGFMGHIPDRIEKTEDGSFRYKQHYQPNKVTSYYSYVNPFSRSGAEPKMDVSSLEDSHLSDVEKAYALVENVCKLNRGSEVFSLANIVYMMREERELLTKDEILQLSDKISEASFYSAHPFLVAERTDAVRYLLEYGIKEKYSSNLTCLPPDLTKTFLLSCDIDVFTDLVDMVAADNQELYGPEYGSSSYEEQMVSISEALDYFKSGLPLEDKIASAEEQVEAKQTWVDEKRDELSAKPRSEWNEEDWEAHSYCENVTAEADYYDSL